MMVLRDYHRHEILIKTATESSTMTTNRLRELASELHSHLQEGAAVGEQERQLLEQVQSDLQQVLDESSSSGEDPVTLTERFNGVALQFEEAHPKVARAIAEAAEILGRMGI
jgi:hypothetical protein